MERVTGIGGIFFRARDPEKLVEWYRDHLGIEPQWPTGTAFMWSGQEGGMTIWSPHKHDTKYFGRETQQFMVNFRVTDLDAMIAQLRAGGAEVDENVQDGEYGKFGWATDPEGNRFELWQPPA